MTKTLGAIGASLENKVRTTEFIAAARHLLIGKSHFAALVSARENRATPGVIELLQKAPVLPATTTDSTWAGPLAPTPAAAAFLETLRDVSAFDRILPDTLRVPPRAKVVAVTAGASGISVGEAVMTPVTKLSTSTVSVEMLKSVAFVVVSRELMEMSGAGVLRFLQRELTGAVARTTDDAFIAALIAGISAIPSSGGTALGVRADLRALADFG